MTKPKKKKKQKMPTNERKAYLIKQKQKRTIVNMLGNMGFDHIIGVDGKHFQFKDRKTEMDDMFVFRNLVVLVEYTTDSNPGEHLLLKDHFYRRVNENKVEFLESLLSDEKFVHFREYFDNNLRKAYSLQEVMIKILYCSKNDVSDSHKKIINPNCENENVIIFDDNIVKYFSITAKSIKKSARFEFFEFMNLPIEKLGLGKNESITSYDGYLLPEERSYFDIGYKVLTFYIDAATLLSRANVFRQNSWRDVARGASYQRMVANGKVNSMREYLSNEKRVFVNNIVGSISIDNLEILYNNNLLKFDSNGRILNETITDVVPVKIKLQDRCNIIRLIDGQHRTYSYYEGTDKYETDIEVQRNKQNLLLTIIIFPNKITETERSSFEAKLFLEINTKQKKVESNLTQEIECLLKPFSTTAISKRVLSELARQNRSLCNRILLNPLDARKDLLKTASIVSYGLNPLVRIDFEKNDSIFCIWNNPNKSDLLKEKNYEALEEYIFFCASKIDELLSSIKMKHSSEEWSVYTKQNDKGILSVTFVNGVLNLLRLLIENKNILDRSSYIKLLEGINTFNSRSYRSSQYRAMGQEMYSKFFAENIQNYQ